MLIDFSRWKLRGLRHGNPSVHYRAAKATFKYVPVIKSDYLFLCFLVGLPAGVNIEVRFLSILAVDFVKIPAWNWM